MTVGEYVLRVPAITILNCPPWYCERGGIGWISITRENKACVPGVW